MVRTPACPPTRRSRIDSVIFKMTRQALTIHWSPPARCVGASELPRPRSQAMTMSFLPPNSGASAAKPRSSVARLSSRTAKRWIASRSKTALLIGLYWPSTATARRSFPRELERQSLSHLAASGTTCTGTFVKPIHRSATARAATSSGHTITCYPSATTLMGRTRSGSFETWQAGTR